MASLPIEILYGIYLGILIGIIPAIVAWALGFVFKYFTGVTIPGFGVVVLAVAIAGANGGLLALTDPTLIESENQARLTVALIVVLMISLYAHSEGDRMGANLPRKISLRKLTERTLSTDVVELVGGTGQVHVTVSGEVGDMEGYPPVPAELRTRVRESEWTFPADIPLVELETRVADRLRTEFDLADVSVRLDERARATVMAAPPVGGLSSRVPTGKRAVSLSTLVPTGLAQGDEVVVVTDGGQYDGSVVSVRSTLGDDAGDEPAPPVGETDGGTDTEPVVEAETPTASGGFGRVTVAVSRPAAEALLSAEVERLVVRARGTRREFELVSLLRRGGKRFRKFTVREGGDLDGTTLGEASVRDTHHVAILAVRHEGRWAVAPRGGQELSAGDVVFAVGTYDDLNRFAEVVA